MSPGVLVCCKGIYVIRNDDEDVNSGGRFSDKSAGACDSL